MSESVQILSDFMSESVQILSDFIAESVQILSDYFWECVDFQLIWIFPLERINPIPIPNKLPQPPCCTLKNLNSGFVLGGGGRGVERKGGGG